MDPNTDEDYGGTEFETLQAPVPDTLAGRRFDQALATMFPDFSRSRLTEWIRSGQGVVDFVDIGVGNWRWPTFNVADSAITIGAIALGLSLWQEGRAQQRAKEARAAEP